MKSFVRKLGFCCGAGTREYCSFAGRLKIRSASIRVFEGLWRKIISLLGCVGMYSCANSESKSGEMVKLDLFEGVKRVVIFRDGFCFWSLLARGEGAIMW